MKAQNKKKTAVVIGGNGNLGTVLCRMLKDNGYHVDPVWLKEDHPDASKASSYKSLPEKIDLAVYLPGLNAIQNTEKLEEEDWDRVFDVNLKGAFLFAKAAFPAMKKNCGATFVVISSIMVTHPYSHTLAYTASKAGLEGLTRELAVEWGQYGISTNCIRLGHLVSGMQTTPRNDHLLTAVRVKTPSHRLIQHTDVASYILWLAEGGSKAISGSIIDFDPAYTIHRWPL